MKDKWYRKIVHFLYLFRLIHPYIVERYKDLTEIIMGLVLKIVLLVLMNSRVCCYVCRFVDIHYTIT